MTWASSLYAYNKLSPNMALYWAFMERACNPNLTLFNFGRCSEGVGHPPLQEAVGLPRRAALVVPAGRRRREHALAR